MASVQDRAKLKRVSYDTWSTREQLCLASSVLKAGDQNWIGVSRSLKPFAEKEALRPPDWFSQKSCAVQYAILLENADAPKRKKRDSGETAGESIVRRLTQERIAELGQILAFQRDEYQQLKAEVNLLRSGSVTEEKLQKMWVAIEQEEREQEQKSRAHSVWLAKRQQKHEAQSLQTATLSTPRKSLEASNDVADTPDPTNDDEEKKNRGGRSPLLTSLLKSPSPTTQIQNPTSLAQVTSPTIASLLGSSPKVPSSQPSQNVSTQSQLHQLVSTTMSSNVAPERPSVGAPTLSMLLELPGNLQRASLANLQTSASTVAQQTPQQPEMHSHNHSLKQNSLINESTMIKTTTINATTNIPATESMVQIIDHIDDVIRKDIMADVIDKDEINEIIGDIEELIKEEITSSPRKITEKLATPEIMENLTIPEVEKIVAERPEPRDVDEPVSQSNSPQSEMAIEEIDQSTSSIAEIIGTVAIEPVETKITIVSVPEDNPENKITNSACEEPEEVEEDEEEEMEEEEEDDEDEEDEEEGEDEEDEEEEEEEQAKNDNSQESKQELKSIEESPIDEKSSTEPEKENIAEETKTTIEKETEKMIDEPKEKFETVEDTKIETKKIDSFPEILADDGMEKEIEPGESSTIASEIDDREENSTKAKEAQIAEIKEKNDSDFDQIEMDLAEITGDRNEIGSTEAPSVCSEVTNDVTSIDDNEKSQDISTILEDDEISQKSCEKTKNVDEKSAIDVAIDGSDSQESLKPDVTTKKFKETSTDLPIVPEIVETIETPIEKIDDETVKTEIPKDSVETTINVVPEIVKNDLTTETPIAESVKPPESSLIPENDEKSSILSPKLEFEDGERKKCYSPIVKDEKSENREESETDLSIEQIDEPKKEEIETKDETEEIKISESDASVKKEIGDGGANMGDDLADLDEEESSLSKLSGGRAMKTYSKKQIIAVDSEPDVETSGENADYRAWKKAVVLMYNRLAAHKYASMFLRPITEDQAPGYHSVIFRPMDLSTIKRNIDNGTIRTTMHFQRDVMLMFQNAIMYNKHDTFVYKMAVSMQEECLQHMQILVQVTGEGQLRRETRTAASSSSEASNASAKRKRSNITPSPHDSDSPRGKKRRKSEND